MCMKHGANLIFSFTLLVGDFLALMGAFGLAYVIRVKLDDRPLLEPITAGGYIGVVAVLLVFWLFVYSLLGLYRSEVFENRIKEGFMLFVGSFVGILFLIGAEYTLNRAIFPARLVTVYGFIFAFLLTLLVRTLARAVRRLLIRFDVGVSNILIVGNTDISQELAERLNTHNSGYRVVGIVGDRRNKYVYIAPDRQFTSFSEAVKKVKTQNISSIVQTELYADQDKNNEILFCAQENHIGYRFVPGNDRLFAGNIDVSLFEGVPTVAVHQTALIGWGRVVKRLFDLFCGVLILIVISPLLLVVWLSLQLFGGGEATFRQTRLTRYNTTFKLYKFRTHKQGLSGLTDEEAFAKLGQPEVIKQYRANGDFLENDPRISRIGRVLRKTSLDELPQIINVIRGDLSLVGPRPLVPQELNMSDKKNVILSVKPGMTGLAVVSGRRDISFDERRKLDMYYVRNWSFLLDVVIILRTIVLVVRRVGAK